ALRLAREVARAERPGRPRELRAVEDGRRGPRLSMPYDPRSEPHGLAFDPFKALVAPRPIGWIGTIGPDGVPNLAPYRFFNAVSDKPPFVLFSSVGRKDSQANIEATGEFTCSFASWELREQMNMSSAPVGAEVDEFDLARLPVAPSRHVRPPRVAGSPAALECRLWKTIELPGDPRRPGQAGNTVIIGEVVGVYIDDAYIRDGRFDTAAARPLARMGYMDYAVVTPETTFEMNRPTVSADGRNAAVRDDPWDGVYR